MKATTKVTITLIMDLKEAKRLHEILYQYSQTILKDSPHALYVDDLYSHIGSCL
jgi:hypothetical protein